MTGPLGDPVQAEWRLDRGTAVIEMARASGLALVGGPDGNDPVAASTVGTGELIGVAVDSGRAPGAGGPGWIGHDRRGAGGVAGPVPAAPAGWARARGAVRRPYALRRRRRGVRPAEGRVGSPGRASAASAGPPGRRLPVRLQGRRARPRRRRGRGRPRRAAWPSPVRRWCRASRRWPTSSTSTTWSRAPTWSSRPRGSSTSSRSRARWSAAWSAWRRPSACRAWQSSARSWRTWSRPAGPRDRVVGGAVRRRARPTPTRSACIEAVAADVLAARR